MPAEGCSHVIRHDKFQRRYPERQRLKKNSFLLRTCGTLCGQRQVTIALCVLQIVERQQHNSFAVLVSFVVPSSFVLLLPPLICKTDAYARIATHLRIIKGAVTCLDVALIAGSEGAVITRCIAINSSTCSPNTLSFFLPFLGRRKTINMAPFSLIILTPTPRRSPLADDKAFSAPSANPPPRK